MHTFFQSLVMGTGIIAEFAPVNPDEQSYFNWILLREYSLNNTDVVTKNRVSGLWYLI